MMHSKTQALKKILSQTQSLGGKVEALHNYYAGETLYILTCGPSINDLECKTLARKLEGRLVMAVKQAFTRFEKVTDFHLYNSAHHQKFSYGKNPDAIRIYARHPQSASLWGPDPDIIFDLDPAGIGKPERALAHTHEFESYLLSHQLLRPFGPGLIYELCFYLAVHMGIKQCTVVAWDLAPDEKTYSHFYNQKTDFFSRVYRRTIRSIGRWLGLLLGARAESWWNYQRGQVYTGSQIFPGEMATVRESTRYAREWLLRHGIELRVLSNRSCVDASIPRIRMDDL
jgi:hypothetical protein